MPELPLQRLSAPNKLQLDLYAGVLSPVFKRLLVMTVVRRSVWRGMADTALFDSIYYVK